MVWSVWYKETGSSGMPVTNPHCQLLTYLRSLQKTNLHAGHSNYIGGCCKLTKKLPWL